MSVAQQAMERLKALPADKQSEALRLIEQLSEPGDAGCALLSVADLKIEGPSDLSERYHETLYGRQARNNE